ncbi:MAG: hypothetical protein AUH11_05660 [Acidobacteria bacterium 13_2_20CM_57_17]|nr:MAG: hypothetical protein AUH11_05660 [Acidobacteria bacterium 13_2_20CM_57_17]OLB96271.1 MAG: hypothetical protein AUI02_02445 [Acidobacteria bacterium 13_2_20CM_2_57_12]
MQERKSGQDSQASLPGEECGTEKSQHGRTCSQANTGELVVVRAKRAKLIEEISYQLIDLITIISGRVEILNGRVPNAFLEDLQAIRKAAMKGMEFSKQLRLAALACRREIGVMHDLAENYAG